MQFCILLMHKLLNVFVHIYCLLPENVLLFAFCKNCETSNYCGRLIVAFHLQEPEDQNFVGALNSQTIYIYNASFQICVLQPRGYCQSHQPHQCPPSTSCRTAWVGCFPFDHLVFCIAGVWGASQSFPRIREESNYATIFASSTIYYYCPKL